MKERPAWKRSAEESSPTPLNFNRVRVSNQHFFVSVNLYKNVLLFLFYFL